VRCLRGRLPKACGFPTCEVFGVENCFYSAYGR
jgi:hypothetical protein